MSDQLSMARPKRNRPPAKWGPGEPITSVEELERIGQDYRASKIDRFVWCDGGGRGRPMHVAMAINFPLGHALALLRAGRIRRTLVRQEYRDWLARELEDAA